MSERTILVVDRNPLTSRRISDYVNEAGMDCVIVEQFDRAREQITRRRFIGMFVDLHADQQAKDKQGLAFVKKIRESDGPHKNIHIAIMCERIPELSDEDYEEIFSAGANGRLWKEEAGVRKPGVLEALRHMANPDPG